VDVAIIDETLAAAIFQEEDPLGQLIHAAEVPDRALRVIGVAPALRNRLADRRPVPHIYLPVGSRYSGVSHVHVRGARGIDLAGLRRALREAPRSAGTRLSVLWVRTLEEARDASPQAWLIRSAARTSAGRCASTICRGPSKRSQRRPASSRIRAPPVPGALETKGAAAVA
jgi:hypothetical protein